MANLTENSDRSYHGHVRYVAYDVGGNLEVFVGQAMIAGANGMVNLTTGSGADFLGFAAEYVNNLTNVEPHEGDNRATKAKVAVEGYVWLSVAKGSPFASTDVGATVYGNDGNTFDLADAGTDVAVGVIVNCDDAVVSGGNTEDVLVKFGPGTV